VKCLQRGLAGAVAADACRSDGVPGLLGSLLLGKRELHVRWDCSKVGIQRPLILIVVNVAVPNCFSHVPHLEPYPHHRGPLDVVGLGEGRAPTVGTDVPDNCLDPMVTMVPVRGGRAAPLVKAAISVDPATGASTLVCAAAAVEGTDAARAPTWSAVDASVPVWVAATAPLGVRGCPLHRLLSRCLPRQLELVIGVAVGRDRATGATAAAAAAFTSALAAVSSVIASLAAIAAVAAISAAARSCSSVAATSASCQCCALEAIER
jgi:hypothetical protein